MLATSYHNVNMPKRQTSFNPEWTKEHEFISKSSRDAFHGFCTLCRSEVYLCISIISRSPEMLFSYTVPDYLFIYVFLLFSEVQKDYVFRHCARLFVYLCISIISRSPERLCFRHCARLFVYLCISIISRSPERLCFQALCQIICLFIYLFYFQKSRNVMFSGTVHFVRQIHLSGQFLKQTSQCLE